MSSRVRLLPEHRFFQRPCKLFLRRADDALHFVGRLYRKVQPERFHTIHRRHLIQQIQDLAVQYRSSAVIMRQHRELPVLVLQLIAVLLQRPHCPIFFSGQYFVKSSGARPYTIISSAGYPPFASL